MDKLAGRIAIVTGGAGLIGSATARLLASHGAHVVVADVDVTGADAVAHGISVIGGSATPYAVDLASIDEVRAMVEFTMDTLGAIDVLHNNAALLGTRYPDLMLEDLEIDVWETILRVNLTAVMATCKFALPHMVRRGAGSIVNTSSIASLLGMDTMPAYSASKGAVNSLTRSIATQYGRYGIRCNSVAPGVVVPPGHPRGNSPWLSQQLLPQAGLPDDVAAAVLFLASDDARFITGQVLCIDGGITAMRPGVPEARAVTTDISTP